MNVDVALTIYSLYSKTTDLSSLQDILSLQRNMHLIDGTGSGKANRHWSDIRTITSGSFDTLDLTSLIDDFGQTLTFTKLKYLYMRNLSTSGYFTLFGSEVPLSLMKDVTDKIRLYPGESLSFTNPLTGMTIGAYSKEIMTSAIEAAGTYEIVLIGEGTVA